MSPDVLDANASSLHHIDQSARCGNEQVAATSQITDLSANVRTAVHHARTYVRTVRKLCTNMSQSAEINHQEHDVL